MYQKRVDVSSLVKLNLDPVAVVADQGRNVESFQVVTTTKTGLLRVFSFRQIVLCTR